VLAAVSRLFMTASKVRVQRSTTSMQCLLMTPRELQLYVTNTPTRATTACSNSSLSAHSCCANALSNALLNVEQVRGMSFSRCFRYYKAAKEAYTGPDAFIINGRDRTFNLTFLKSFFTLACNGTTVSANTLLTYFMIHTYMDCCMVLCECAKCR
jgi:hypothetical protein